MVIRWLIAAVTALILAVTLAVPAGAYQNGLCWVGGDQYARLSASKWDTSYWYGSMYITSTRYHLDMNSHGKYYAKALYIDGVKQLSWNDVYWNTGAPTTHWIRGQWYYYYGESVAYTYCSFYL